MYALAKKTNESELYRVIDMRSDTVSIPTVEMRMAMAEAKVGDDVYGEDPTINELEERCARLFGMEAGLFVPSGTMANLIAIMAHCNKRGAEAIVGSLSHTFLYEQGGAAYIAGVQLNTIQNKTDGTFCLNEFRRKIRGHDQHEPKTMLAIIENTHNICGGKVLPISFIDELADICKEHSIAVHMDGARIFNAAEVLNVPVSRIVKNIQSVCFCLSKGLSAPVGSVLIGSKEFIASGRRFRKALGGGMRQAGILAAAGLVALDTIVPKLGEDHKNVMKIANAINNNKSESVIVNIDEVQSNILLIQMPNDKIVSSEQFVNRLLEVKDEEITNNIIDENGKGIVVKISARDWGFARIVIYHQITAKDIDLAIKKIIYCINEYDGKI